MAPPISVGIIGAGAAGLITAKILQDDGFDVRLLTRDASPGGVWAKERIYPGLSLNNVHGEFRFSSLPMTSPVNAEKTGGRLTGEAMQDYMESFARTFLCDRVTYGIEVLNISRDSKNNGTWIVRGRSRDIKPMEDDRIVTFTFDKIVVCTGGCSEPYIPPNLSPDEARQTGFLGTVCHSSTFAAEREKIMNYSHRPIGPSSINFIPAAADAPGTAHVLIVGGGKSAQDAATFLANYGTRVTMVFETADAFIAAPVPLPDFIRKSRFLSVLSPYISLRTRLEKFLHTTTIGSAITLLIWNLLTWSSFLTFSIPRSSPLRRAHSLFWGIRTNDEGVGSPNGFFSLVNKGKIDIIAPLRVERYALGGKGVVLSDGRILEVETVVLATGFTSSWAKIFSEETREEIGLGRQDGKTAYYVEDMWINYKTLANPPIEQKGEPSSALSMYRGIVPVKNLLRRDLAVNGAVFNTNNGYIFEVTAHWISSYFLNDSFLRLPNSTEEAMEKAQITGAWLRKRYPGMHSWVNESYSSAIVFWNYPQFADDLLEDMQLATMRGARGWLSWPFSVIDMDQIKDLNLERERKRSQV